MTASTGRTWSTHRWIVVLAVGYQWFYNGANFLAFKVAGDALHPLMVAALRFVTAALVLLPFAVVRWRRTPASGRELGGAALLGFVMLVVSQAGAIWGTHFLPAGVAAVFGSASPLFLALFAWRVLHRPLKRRQVAGVLVGFVGLALMSWASASSGDFRVVGAVLALTASAAWAAGSLMARRLPLPRDALVSLTAQLVSAGVILGAIVATSGIAAATHLGQVSPSAWGALTFLVVASTLVGYAVFLAINAELSSTLANTFNYAAPVIALGLAGWLLHEPMTVGKLISGGIALVGVALMIDRDSLGATSR